MGPIAGGTGQSEFDMSHGNRMPKTKIQTQFILIYLLLKS